jgi:two-component system, OmpR family, heavy metal sensor histidine kinase CusS
VKPILFRLKIALLSLLMSGVVVIAFGIFFLHGIQKVGLERIDREIAALGASPLRVRHLPEFWEGFERSLSFIYGSNVSSRLFVQVRDAEGRIFFSSTQCPDEVSGIAMPSMPFLQIPSSPGLSRDRLPMERRRQEQFVQRLDKDGDARVSAGEFDGPEDQFPVFDENRNGYIDVDEAPSGPPPTRADDLPMAQQRQSVFETTHLSSRSWRLGIMGNEYVTLFVGLNLADLHADTGRFQRAFLVAAPLALLLLAAGGWVLATRALRPVALITQTAENISARDLSRRVPPVSADAELARLVDVINGMLARLERSYGQAIRFSGDAAHELQTPLTVLQGELDNAVQSAAPGSEEQQRYGALLEEVQRLKVITQKLLLLSRADAGRLALSPSHIDLSAMLASAMEDVGAMAPNLRIEKDFQPGVEVFADEALLGQALGNMAANAVKYNTEGGLIRFELKAEDGWVRFTLRNSGERIPPEDREKVFDRFYRVDKSHSRSIPGAGLGLSLAREIARAHGGDLVLDPDAHDLISFTLTLPRS